MTMTWLVCGQLDDVRLLQSALLSLCSEEHSALQPSALTCIPLLPISVLPSAFSCA